MHRFALVLMMVGLCTAVQARGQTDTCSVAVTVNLPDTTRGVAGSQVIIEARIENPSSQPLVAEVRCSVGGIGFAPVVIDRLAPGTVTILPIVTLCFGATDTLTVSCEAESAPVDSDCLALQTEDAGILACGAAVPVERKSWGLLKFIYGM